MRAMGHITQSQQGLPVPGRYQGEKGSMAEKKCGGGKDL